MMHGDNGSEETLCTLPPTAKERPEGVRTDLLADPSKSCSNLELSTCVSRGKYAGWVMVLVGRTHSGNLNTNGKLQIGANAGRSAAEM